MTVAVMDIKDLSPEKSSVSILKLTMHKGNCFIGSNRSIYLYIYKLGEMKAKDKLNVLINHVSATVYELLSKTSVYDDAINHITNTYARYIQKKNRKVYKKWLCGSNF